MSKTSLFNETLHCKASFYLDYMGYEITREEFMRELLDYHGYMLYVGEGYCPLVVAVATVEARSMGHRDGDCSSEAVSIFEDWCRKTGRQDEIGEGQDWDEMSDPEYQLFVEPIPKPVVAMPVEVNRE